MNDHLLSMHDLTAGDVTKILDTSGSFREVGSRVIKKVPALRGRTVVKLVLQNSTRTRISFELAATRLSPDASNFSAGGATYVTRQSPKERALTLPPLG